MDFRSGCENSRPIHARENTVNRSTSVGNDDNECLADDNTVTPNKRCDETKDPRSASSSTPSTYVDDSPENSFTLDMHSSPLYYNQDDGQIEKEGSNLIIPKIVSFESPIRKIRRDSTDSVYTESEPDVCQTDVDTDMSRDGMDCVTATCADNSGQGKHKKSTVQKDVSIVLHTPSKANESQNPSPKIKPVQKAKKSELKKFTKFRFQYLVVHTAIMLADGLQGTHLYVLYEGYGYSVSSLYALGFVSGAITSPFIGPVVDKIGRKRAAIVYCLLEVIINYFEQYPIFAGLLVSRVLGGITTNLLFSVFESWLVTEHRKRGFEEEKLEIILRDSTIVSNSAAIISGYLAHRLAEHFGPVGPFEGAVGFTIVALLIVWSMWTENYGSTSTEKVTWKGNMVGAYSTIVKSSKITRIGIIQGLTEGSLQTFVFLWAPALRAYSNSAVEGVWGLDRDGDPAYGLIFGSFMAFGVVGGFLEPTVRKAMNSLLNSMKGARNTSKPAKEDGEVDPTSVHLLCALCYISSSILLLTPFVLREDNKYAFSICFAAFLFYELMVGLYMPCEGVVRSIYMPNESICSLMTMLRVIVNIAVACGVISTNFIPFTYAFGILSIMMVTSACLQLSLISRKNLSSEEIEKKTK